MRKINKEIFINKSKIIHGEKFDYTLVDYKNVRTKVKIICSNCGVFEQLPWVHMKGNGCSKCQNLTKETFINNSTKVHGYKYNYDKVDITNNKTKIIIECKEHGFFKQTPAAHMRGQGCYNCFIKRKTLTNDDFINKSNQIHNYK